MKSATGYSGTPLAKKLGIKSGFAIRLINEPDYYFQLFVDMPDKVLILTDTTIKKDLIHFFAKRAKDIQDNLLALKGEIKQDGIIWVSWYKKASKIPTDITEDFIRDFALANGLVDVKVCAIDDVWSGLKLVIPVKLRRADL